MAALQVSFCWSCACWMLEPSNSCSKRQQGLKHGFYPLASGDIIISVQPEPFDIIVLIPNVGKWHDSLAGHHKSQRCTPSTSSSHPSTSSSHPCWSQGPCIWGRCVHPPHCSHAPLPGRQNKFWEEMKKQRKSRKNLRRLQKDFKMQDIKSLEANLRSGQLDISTFHSAFELLRIHSAVALFRGCRVRSASLKSFGFLRPLCQVFKDPSSKNPQHQTPVNPMKTSRLHQLPEVLLKLLQGGTIC